MKIIFLILFFLVNFLTQEIKPQIVKKAFTNKSVYTLGETVTFRFQAVNTSTEVDSLVFPNLCEAYPFVDGKSYLSIFHLGCFLSVSVRILAPNDTLEWKWDYPRESRPDSILAVGEHFVYGYFRNCPSNTDTISFTVKRGLNSLKEEEETYSFVLEQNYPNPFNPTTTISYSIPKKDFVTLKIFDGLGKEIAIIANGVKNSGNYSIEFDASKLTSGIYFYRLTTSKFAETKKMLLLR
jgi:hypothetical protein